MASGDEEIEFLDEDADIIQQFRIIPTELKANNLQKDSIKPNQKSLIRERPFKRKKTTIYERDDDYEPKQFENKYVKRDINSQKSSQSITKPVLIPDLDDSICLPVVVVHKTLANIAKIHKWNKECLKAYKEFDDPLLPGSPDVKIRSTKTTILRNVMNRNGAIEASVRNKVIVTNSEGEKKVSCFSGILPRFEDNYKSLKFKLHDSSKKTCNMVLSQNTVLLTQDKDVLTVYNPTERLSKSYKFTEKMRVHYGERVKRVFLEETSSQNVCTSCYQCQETTEGYSNNLQYDIRCEICKKMFVSTYLMLSHLKTHDQKLVLAKRKEINSALVLLTQYIHKCRICQISFPKINMLKEHLATHSGTTLIKCDVGHHVTK